MDRHRQARWDLENLRSVGTKLTPQVHDALRLACDTDGISIYALVRRLLLEWLMDWAKRNPERVNDIMVPLSRR